MANSCQRCNHERDNHRDNICYTGFCTCMEFEEDVPVITQLNNNSKPVNSYLYNLSNWNGDGWDYAKKYGKSQKEMVGLYVLIGKNIDEIQELLRCKRSSIRGRMSELRNSDFIVKK